MHVSKTMRVFSLILALLVSLALFAGCKGEDKNASSKETASTNYSDMDNTEVVEEFENKEHPTLPQSKDLGGMEITIATGKVDMIMPEEGSSAEGDLKLEALREVQTKYNCKIVLMDVQVWDEVSTAILSGEQYANILQPCLHQTGTFVQSRLCADYLEEDIAQYVDMSQPWWNDTMAYASNVLGSVYAGASSLCAPARYTWIVYFNKNIAKEVGIGENELYDLWEKKEWTWDALAKYAKMAVKDLDGSGAMDSEEDRWGFMAPGYDCAQAFTSSAKIASITTENGMNPVYTFNTNHAITGLTKLNAMFTTDGYFKQTGEFKRVFAEGQTLFMAYMLGHMNSVEFRDMDDDWGILPLPLGPKEGGGWQDKYLSRVDHNSRALLIPATAEDKASTALVLEALSFNYFRIINQEIETMALSYLRDDKSVEISGTIYNTTTYEISQFFYSVNNYEWNKQVESLATKVVSSPNLDVSGTANACAQQAQQMIDDYFNGI